MISAVLVVIFGLLPIEDRYARLALFLIPYLIIGYDILRKAVLGIVNGQVFDENFLMALATVGAIILGEYTEGTAVMLFYQIGELFQSYALTMPTSSRMGNWNRLIRMTWRLGQSLSYSRGKKFR